MDFCYETQSFTSRSSSSCLLADLRNLQLLFCWTYSLCFVWILLFSCLLLLLYVFPSFSLLSLFSVICTYFVHSPLLSSWDLSSNSLSIFILLYLFHPQYVLFYYYFLFSFLLTGDIFLLNTSRLPDRCKFSLHSPILPGSVDSCLLELAVYSQDAVPLLQRFTVEIRYVDTNRNIIISLKVGHEEEAG